MKFEATLDRWHAKAVNNFVLRRFADYTRVLLAIGFFAPGLHKLMGIRFTNLPLENPIGAFFEALYQTGFYYRFIGAAQVLAAMLILFRLTSPLGALLFFSITLNVFIVTVSIPFGWGTPIVTGLMLLASLYLVCWNYDKLKPLLSFSAATVSYKQIDSVKVQHPNGSVSKIGYWVFAVSGIILMCELRGLLPRDFSIRRSAWLVSLLGGLIMLSGFVIDALKKIKSP